MLYASVLFHGVLLDTSICKSHFCVVRNDGPEMCGLIFLFWIFNLCDYLGAEWTTFWVLAGKATWYMEYAIHWIVRNTFTVNIVYIVLLIILYCNIINVLLIHFHWHSGKMIMKWKYHNTSFRFGTCVPVFYSFFITVMEKKRCMCSEGAVLYIKDN